MAWDNLPGDDGSCEICGSAHVKVNYYSNKTFSEKGMEKFRNFENNGKMIPVCHACENIFLGVKMDENHLDILRHISFCTNEILKEIEKWAVGI
jgi:hypothetical protein